MATKKQSEASIDVVEISRGMVSFHVVGTAPIVCNRMANKQTLLIPAARKKNAAEKASTLKHNPYEEFRSSPYTDKDPAAATLLQHLSSAFKGALKGAALDMPGATKSQIGRLTFVEGERVSIFGIPKIYLSVVRSADINRTPDIRTRAIIPQWACVVNVSFVEPMLTAATVARLFAAAGIYQGVGDGRVGKGTLNFGTFRIADPDDDEFTQIVESGGREAQARAMAQPEPYDDESAEMLSMFDAELAKRGVSVARVAA